MPRNRTKVEEAAGKLISEIQKEWGKELGEPIAYESEEIVSKAHDLLQAVKYNNISSLLSGITISEFLGISWVQSHQSIKPFIENLEIEFKKFNLLK